MSSDESRGTAGRFTYGRIAVRVILAGALLVGGVARSAETASTPTPSSNVARELSALEERSYDAWKAGDAKFWNGFLSDHFVGWGPSGRIDKRAAVAALGGADCQIGSVRLVGTQVTELTPTVALLTHRTEVSGTCRGKALPPAAYTATVYVREGGLWKAGYRAQSSIVDPMKATRPPGGEAWTGGPSRTDAATRQLLAREQAVVTAWKDRDSGRMAALFGPKLQFVDIFGDHIGDRGEALKAWSGDGCDVKSFDLRGAKATMFGPDFGVLTYLGIFDGKCFGQDLWPIWATAFYVRHDDVWLWSSGINVLAGAVDG